MGTIAIRGATTVEENNSKSIISNTIELLKEIEKKNNLDKEKVISILFSSTRDLNKEYPAKAARVIGYKNAALMCFNEMEVLDNLKKCIRVMVLYDSSIGQNNVKHVYLKEAKNLRPDLNK